MTIEAGDLVWAEFDPVSGTEQGGRRPALVVSVGLYHTVSSRAVVCPVSSSGGHWPFNVALPEGMRTRGFVLIDQVRTVHRDSRLFRPIEKAPDTLLAEVRQVMAGLLGIVVVLPPERIPG